MKRDPGSEGELRAVAFSDPMRHSCALVVPGWRKSCIAAAKSAVACSCAERRPQKPKSTRKRYVPAREGRRWCAEEDLWGLRKRVRQRGMEVGGW